MKTALLLLVAAGSVAPLVTQDSTKPPIQEPVRTTSLVKTADIKWGDHPFIHGAKMCVQTGDPAKGASVLMMKFPKGMTIPAHWHTSQEAVTIITGSGVFGSGEKVDAAHGTELGAGSYVIIPGKNPHWAIAKEDLVITVTLDKAADFHLCGEDK
jgi:quercetin dioxygenase-like cupin family protein